MRRLTITIGLTSVLSCICACTSWNKAFPPEVASLPNQAAIDRALQHSSLTDGDQPFHLLLEVAPPSAAHTEMRAGIEIFWLNRITYRTVIHSRDFSQTRIVNGNVVEEHSTGSFYPRWIQNFVDAVLQPIPQLNRLRKVPGSVPVDQLSHACITSTDPSSAEAPNETPSQPSSAETTNFARVCFEDAEPKIASGQDFARYISFDDFAPFGQQQIARTLVNDLPTNLMVRGRIILLEPLRSADYPQLRAREFTLPAQQLLTATVTQVNAQAMLETERSRSTANRQTPSKGPTLLYIRTDRTGRVCEAYPEHPDSFAQPPSAAADAAAVARALNLKFKPLLIKGAPTQMEAPYLLP